MTVVAIGPYYALPGVMTVGCKWFDPNLRALKSHLDCFTPEALVPVAAQSSRATVRNGFKVGDVVQLNSGGPNMTVTSIAQSVDSPTLTIWVEWINPDCSDYAFPRLAAISFKWFGTWLGRTNVQRDHFGPEVLRPIAV